jgi:hypothetical protein
MDGDDACRIGDPSIMHACDAGRLWKTPRPRTI